MRNPYLQAFQERILHVTFKADPKALAPYIPSGTEPIELEDGVALGLTASIFRDLIYKGVRISGENILPKIDLRSYVTWKSRDGKAQSGAVLLDECLPQKRNVWVSAFLLSNAARAVKIAHENHFGQDGLISQFRWGGTEGNWNSLKVGASKDMDSLEAGGDERLLDPTHFFLPKKGNLKKVRVEHPEWKLHPVFDREVHLDPTSFSLPKEGWDWRQPRSAHSLEGSNVSFSKPSKHPR